MYIVFREILFAPETSQVFNDFISLFCNFLVYFLFFCYHNIFFLGSFFINKVGRPSNLDFKNVSFTAMKLFIENGFQNVSINEICRESDQHKQSVYNYFGDLDGIQLSAIKLYNELVISPEWSKYEKLNNFFDKLDLRLTTALKKNTSLT